MSEQRVAIVTGGGRRWGMGWQIALGLATKGLDLAIADIREDWGKEAAESIKAETGRRVIFVQTDVSKRDSVQAMAAKVIAEFGRVESWSMTRRSTRGSPPRNLPTSFSTAS